MVSIGKVIQGAQKLTGDEIGPKVSCCVYEKTKTIETEHEGQ